MYQSSIGSKIEEFLKIEKERISKIDGKIEGIDNKIQKAKEQINSLEDECVKCDLEDNIPSKEKAEKSITSLRRDLENIEGQRSAYERAKDNDQGAKAKAIKVQKEAAKEVAKVNSLFQDKINESNRLEEEKKMIDKKLREIKVEIESFRYEPENIAGQVVKLEKYIYGKGILDERVKASGSDWYTKAKLVLADLLKM